MHVGLPASDCLHLPACICLPCLSVVARVIIRWQHELPFTNRNQKGSPLNRPPFDSMQPPSWLPLKPPGGGGVDAGEVNLWLGAGSGTSRLHADPCVVRCHHVMALAPHLTCHGAVAFCQSSGYCMDYEDGHMWKALFDASVCVAWDFVF